MWIAKNSITGKEYGKAFKSIYDCQAFINKELIVLEYEMQRCFSLEKNILDDLSNKGKSFFDIIQEAISNFVKESDIEETTKLISNALFDKSKQEDLDKKIQDLANKRWQRNNIIRCWYVEQKRFADGFDF